MCDTIIVRLSFHADLFTKLWVQLLG